MLHFKHSLLGDNASIHLLRVQWQQQVGDPDPPFGLGALLFGLLLDSRITPTLTAQNCGSYSFDARIKILTEMYWSRQYLSIDPKKNLPRPL